VDFHAWSDPDGHALVKSVAHKANVDVVAVSPHRRISQYVFWEELFNVLTGHGITTGVATTSEYALAFSMDSGRLTDGLLHELEKFGRVEVLQHRGSVCLVGKGMRRTTNLLPRVFRALEGIEISMISFGASDVNITLVISGERLHEAVNRLHAEFFEHVSLPDVFEDVT
jgi:aspartate kinase